MTSGFVIPVSIDTKPARQKVNEFYSFMEGKQAQAALKGAKVATLPKGAVAGAFNEASNPAALQKSTINQRQFIKDKAKLLGLLERQIALTTQAAGGRLDKQGMPMAAAPRQAIASARAGVESSIARSLGLDQLTPALKGQLTKALNEVRTGLTSALSGLSGTALQRGFSKEASATLASISSVDVSRASTVSAEKAVAQSQHLLAALTKDAEAASATAAIDQQRRNVASRLLSITNERLTKSKSSAVLTGRVSEAEARVLKLSNERAALLNRVISKTKVSDAAAAYKTKLTGEVDPKFRALSVAATKAAPEKYKQQLMGTPDPINRALSVSAASGAEAKLTESIIAKKRIADEAAKQEAAAAAKASKLRGSLNNQQLLAEETVVAQTARRAASEAREAAEAEKSRRLSGALDTRQLLAKEQELRALSTSAGRAARVSLDYKRATGAAGGGSGVPPTPPVIPGFGDDEFDPLEVALQRYAAALMELAVLQELTADQLRPLYADQLARIRVENQVIKTATLGRIAGSEKLLQQYGGEKAAEGTYHAQIAAQTERALAPDTELHRPRVEADATTQTYRQLRKAATELYIAQTGLSREVIESMTLEQIAQATLKNDAAADAAHTKAAGELTAATKRATLARLQSYVASGEAAKLEPQIQATRDQIRSLRTGPVEKRKGFAGLIQGFGYDRTGGTTPREFFGGGALASLRYGLPSMLFYSAISGISNTVKEAEELNYALSILEGQFESTFEGQDFSPVRQQILDIAQDTGLAADELALLRVQLTGAFGEESIGGFSGADLIEEQTLAAAKLAQTVKLPLEEITDGLTAASLAFEGATFERIGDVAVRLEEVSGVLAKETVSFIGDIAPVAEEAGYSLEEFSAIAAVAQQRSGRSGAALAEAFGRVIPEITKAKDELFALASTEDALANADFIDAIRQSDPKAILEQIGAAYADVSDRGQQQITQILGGRREAQVIIPVITNQDAIEEFTREAESSAGSLDRRFEKVRETLTNTFQRLSEKVREFVITILDSGITDLLEEVANILGSIAGILSPILGIVGEINSGLAGWPIRILAALAAYKTFVAFRQAEDTRRGAFAGGIAGIPGRAKQNFIRGAAPIAFQNTGNLYPQAAVSQLFATRSTGRLAASGRGLLAVLGGGSVATGGLLAGAVALTAAYTTVRNQINEENEALKEVVDEISKENVELDVFSPDTDQRIRDRRVAALERQAAGLQDDYEAAGIGFEKINVALLGAQSKAEAVLAQAAQVEVYDPDVESFYQKLDLQLQQTLSEDFAPKLGKPTKDFRRVLQEKITDEFGTFGDKFRDAATESPLGYGSTGFAKDEQRYLNTVAELAGVKREQLDERLALALLENNDNVPKALDDIISGQAEVTGAITADLKRQAAAMKESLKLKAEDDTGFQEELDALAAIELSPLDEAKIQYEQLSSAYEAGAISFKEYITRLKENSELRREIVNISGDSSAAEAELFEFLKTERADAEAASSAIKERQGVLTKIAEALGANEAELEFKSAVDATRNLNDPNFTDRNARLDAALELQKARVNTELRIAQEAGDIDRVNQIINEGIDIDPQLRAIIYTEQLINSDDNIEELVSSHGLISGLIEQNIREAAAAAEEPIFRPEDIADAVRVGETPEQASARLYEIYKGRVQEVVEADLSFLDQPIEKTIEEVLEDVFDDGVLSEDNLSRLNSILGGIGAGLQVEGLTETQINALYGTLDGIVQLLAFAGVAQSEIVDAIAGPEAGLLQRTAVQFQVGKAVGSSQLDQQALETARADSDAKARADKIRELEFDFKKVQARHNDVAIAYLELEAANAELLSAKAEKGPEKDIKIKEAEIRIAKANQQIEDSVLEQKKRGIELQKALAEVAGDSVQAAVLEAASVGLDLQNDPENESIQAQFAKANDNIRKQMVSKQESNYELLSAMADFNGDTVGAARVSVAQAQFVLNNARGTEDRNAAKVSLLQAQKQLRDALRQQRAEQFDLLTAIVAGEDPLAQAKIAQAEAKEILQGAVGPSEIAQARIALIEADRAVNKAMQDIRSSIFDLRQAQLDAVGDEVGSAQVAAQQARAQLQDAISNKAGEAQINSLRAQVITADKAAKDAVFDERRDEYDFLFEMGKITKSQYINYLEGLKSTLIPGTAQFRDLELAIKRLKDDIGSDLQANLPTSLALPTLYEVRRFSQTPGSSPSSGAAGTSIGYQDNRQINAQITIAQNMSEDEIVDVLGKALGVGTSGYAARRY